MKLIKTATQQEVFDHWKEHDTNSNEGMRDRLTNMEWGLFKIQQGDITALHIIHAADWTYEHQLTLNGTVEMLPLNSSPFEPVGNPKAPPLADNKIETVHKNYLVQVKKDRKRALEILARREGIRKKETNTRLIFISDTNEATENYVCVEGNRRLIALLDLNKLVGCEVYIGRGPDINKNFPWYWTSNYRVNMEEITGDRFNYMWTNGKEHDQWTGEESWEEFYARRDDLNSNATTGFSLVRWQKMWGPQVKF